MKRIIKYYKITFTLASPLAMGCGENYLTDSDIIRDSRGLPYIPGTALAGVYRRIFSDKTAEKYFGPELTKEKINQAAREGTNPLSDSAVRVYDAHLLNPEKRVIGKRDMVALDEYKTAIEGLKFDFEILEPGVTFVTYLEQTMEQEEQQYVSDEIAAAWLAGKITLGAKTRRGYGKTEGVKAEPWIFHLEKKEKLELWLDFDMYKKNIPEEVYGKCEESAGKLPSCLSALMPGTEVYRQKAKIYQNQEIQLAEEPVCRICLELKQQGGLSIRQYSTDVDEADYKQLTRKGGASEDGQEALEGVPVIPGTSWAGAFRAHMSRLEPEFSQGNLAEKIFGSAKEKGQDSQRSRIRFSESSLRGGLWVTYTRNAIDRFTGGTVDGALYTEKAYFNGRTSLEIDCDFDGLEKEDRKEFARIMAGAILDLHNGYLSVGGLTAVGRGLFRVTKLQVGNAEISLPEERGESVYFNLMEAIAGKEEQ